MKTLSIYIFRSTAWAALIGLGLLSISACKKNNTPEPTIDPATLPAITKITNGLISGNPTSVTDNIGKPNDFLNIYGRNFSKDFKDSKVFFDNISAQVRYGDSTSLMVIIPDDIPIGQVSVTVVTNGKSVTLPNKLKVEPPNPQIEGISAEAGMVGSRLALQGQNFSTRLANNKVTVNGVSAVIDSVSLNTVFFTVPQTTGLGKVVLTTHGTILTYSKNLAILSSTFSTFTTAYNYGPRSLTADAAGNLYGIVGGTVVKINPAGTSTVLAAIGAANATFLSGCVADATGNVYVSSPYDSTVPARITQGSNNCKVYKISPTGTVSVLAGGNYPGYADGQGTAALFNYPEQLAIDAADNVYVIDGVYIRKITPAGVVSTLAGNNSTTGGPVDGQGTAAKFGGFLAMNIDAKTGDLYVLEPTAYDLNTQNYTARIRKVTSGGLVTTPVINPVAGALPNSLFGRVTRYNNQLAVDASGAIYIGGGAGLYKIKDGAVTNTYLNATGGDLLGMVFDSTGKLYITAPKTFNQWGSGATYAVYKITP